MSEGTTDVIFIRDCDEYDAVKRLVFLQIMFIVRYVYVLCNVTGALYSFFLHLYT
jgi:hypothetical protein